MRKILIFMLLTVASNLSLAMGRVITEEYIDCESANGLNFDGITTCFQEYGDRLSNLILYKAQKTNTVSRWQKDKENIIKKCKSEGKRDSEYSGFEQPYYGCLMDAYADFNRNTKYLEK